MVTDADRLAADGKAVEIAGHSFHVRYTPRSFKLLEDRYGSIMKVGEALEGMQTGQSGIFGPIFHILSLGLRHEMVDGQPVTEDWLLDNGDPREFADYANVAFSAIVEALPTSSEPSPNVAGTNGASPGASPGANSSMPPSFALVSRPESSGTE